MKDDDYREKVQVKKNYAIYSEVIYHYLPKRPKAKNKYQSTEIILQEKRKNV